MFMGALVLFGLMATILLAWRFDTKRLLTRDFPEVEPFAGRLYRCRIYAGGEASTLSDVGADARGIYLQPPKDLPKGARNFFWNSSGLYCLKKPVFIPWDIWSIAVRACPFTDRSCSGPLERGDVPGAARDGMRLFADASREFPARP